MQRRIHSGLCEEADASPMRPTVEMQNNGPSNKEMVLAVGGDLFVAIVRRKREENKEARVKVDSRAKEEKSEFQGKTEGSGSNNNMGGVFSWIGNPAVIPSMEHAHTTKRLGSWTKCRIWGSS